MVEKTSRREDAGGPRSADGRRFEVFVRDEETDPLRHVGTVAAPTADAAHEEASKLFAWYARDVWVCPAAEVSRYSASSLASDDEADPDAVDRDDTDTDAADRDETAANDDAVESGEPRVYEETEGTPDVAGGGNAVDASAEGSR